MNYPIAIIENIRNVISPIHGNFQQAIVRCPYCHERHKHGYDQNEVNHKVSHCNNGTYICVKPEQIKLNLPNGK